MARGRTPSLTIRLTPAERLRLLAWQRAPRIPAGLARRARLLLLLAAGMTITEAAATVGLSRRHSYKWIRRWLILDSRVVMGQIWRNMLFWWCFKRGYRWE
jgi:hypothetical protein